jgi:hypothetical protein
MKHGSLRSSRLLLVVALGGCPADSGPKARFSCVCRFLTDTDGTSEVVVDLCAKDAAAAEARAPGCAQAGAPATVQGCSCSAATGPCAAAAPDCTVRDHR